MRGFIRHPADMPIEMRLDGAGVNNVLHDVGRGGLCFLHATVMPVGSLIRVRIETVSPAFEARCRVAGCHADGGARQVGAAFIEPKDVFRARMVEQICHIERQRREQQAKHGRSLSGHEAACEWIEKFANHFPGPEQDA